MKKLDSLVLFKKLVRHVEIEISSLCNRKCIYCPVKDINRPRDLLSLDVFESIMRDLQSVNYSGYISFHQFNEPLLELSHLFQCIERCKKHVRSAKLKLYTNGDRLTDNLLKELAKVGMDEITVSCHLNTQEGWSKDIAVRKISDMCKKLKLPPEITLFEASARALYNFPATGLILEIASRNFLLEGSNRMGTVESLKLPRHRNVCDLMLNFINISYKGNGYICCDCCEGVKGVEKYSIGSVLDGTIFDLFENKKSFIRDYLFDEMPKCCQMCTWF